MVETLLLVPTRVEASGLFGPDRASEAAEGIEIEELPDRPLLALSGFGLAAAGARAAKRIAEHRPARCLLVGIAGTLDPAALAVGEVLLAEGVAVDGLGAGEGEGFVPADSLGFPQLPGLPPGPLSLRAPTFPGTARGLLLSVAAASDGAAQIARRRARHPDALAEDMEAWAVALACRDAGVPLTILRGISNRAGERDPALWRSSEALDRLREVLSALPSA